MGDVDGLKDLMAAWPENQLELRQAFEELTEYARTRPGTNVSLISRAGVSHSFRATAEDPNPERDRPFFLLVDVIVSEADPWFISVCFFEDDITDPEDLGDSIPQGLFGENGCCFDVDDYDADLLSYVTKRIAEAHGRAMAS
jgi:hypothetical protein